MTAVDEFHKRQAKELVNLLHDKRFLNDDLSREAMDWLEEFLAFTVQSRVEIAVKCAALTASLRDKRRPEATTGELP